MDEFDRQNHGVNSQNPVDEMGDAKVQVGDYVGGDKITVGDITNSIVAIGNRAEVRITKLFSEGQAHEMRNRRQLIQNVRATWIKGVLGHALYKSTWIELGLKQELDQVNRPWHMTWYPEAKRQILSEDASLGSVYQDDAANTLLILGAPGSGKTVTLLDLAQQLLDEAEQDLVAPIPVVFNLSSWALKRQALLDWLLEELRSMYSVPKNTGQRWLEHDALVLLLDGLDEVAEAHRQTCVKMINDYREEHGLTGMVVCSRLKEYEVLPERLNLLGAVVIQPLSVSQSDQYLRQMGKQLQAVRALLGEDKILQEWVRSPLLLYVVAMAYSGLAEDQLRKTHTGSFHQLYNAYVDQMLCRHRPYQTVAYPPEQVRKWLAFLAGRMAERGLTVYQMEQMQTDWLRPLVKQPKSQSSLERFIGLKGLPKTPQIPTLDRHWSLSDAVVFVKQNIDDVLATLGVGLFIGIIVWLFDGFSAGLRFGAIIGFSLAIYVVILYGLVGGIIANRIKSRERPNEGIWHSATNGIFSLLGIVMVYLGFMLTDQFSILFRSDLADLIIMPANFLLMAIGVGLFFFVSIGVLVFTQHFYVRKMLQYHDYLPWQLVPFLEYAKERLLLQRVGGGYIFIHRTLQDYFASQDTSFDKSSTK